MSLIHSFLKSAMKPALATTRRIGVITDVTSAGSGLYTVALGGDITNPIVIPSLFTPGYSFKVNDVVVVLSAAGDHVILGAVTNLSQQYYRAGFTRFQRNNSTRALLTATWTELQLDTVTDGGDQTIGQAYISGVSNGKIVIPNAGGWEIVGSVLWPTAAAAYARTIVSIYYSGNVDDGNSRNRNEQFPNVVTSHIQNSNGGWPIVCNAGDQFSVYGYQTSGGTVTIAAGDIIAYAYRIW